MIADYAARGKRVLFVCEKRAAIDVVFHRLRQQGLDELCCLIHDSQTDKKAFIQNLKQTYEKFLGQTDTEAEALKTRTAALCAIEQELASLRRFSDTMKQASEHTGISLQALLHRLVEIRGHGKELPAEVEEILPDYPLWLAHGELIERLRSALSDIGDEICFAKHPLRWLGSGVLKADRPLEALNTRLDQAEDTLDAIENALELSGLPGELWDTFEEIQVIVDFAVRAQPLAERNLLVLLMNGPAAGAFDGLIQQLEEKSRALEKAGEKTVGWREPLAPEDTQNALAQARDFENSMFRFLQPAFWRLKKTLQARYDFSRHAVAPKWSKILQALAAQQQAAGELEALRDEAGKAWKTDDPMQFQQLVKELRNDRLNTHSSVRALIEKLGQSPEAGKMIQSLAALKTDFSRLDETLRFLLAEHQRFDFPELATVLGTLREQSGLLAELQPMLEELTELPGAFGYALRHAPVPLNEFEGAVGHRSLNRVYREDRAVSRFEGRILEHKMQQLEKRHREWLAVNAQCIRAAVRRRFLEHVNISAQPASQLDVEQKAFKKIYAVGRRDLEHEFGKTMRYKSIRDLAAGNSGEVVKDLKPIWLMSPLSVSDTLPLDPKYFDVVIFDEASQIPLEEAIPALYRSGQVIVVGDEMQLPPTTFFASSRGEDESVVVEEEGERFEVDLDSDSFLTQSATNLPSTLLAWHYRSRYEALISFSNAAFYSGNLFTIPDRQRLIADRPELRVTAVEQVDANVDALLARSISFHLMEKGVYEDRRNPTEAAYIARIVRQLLQRQTGLSIGIVAFSEAQQTEIEDALGRLAEDDPAFASQLETEYVREENDQFCGLIVKNLENIQGDERDVILMSVCYGRDAGGRMLMNFGPINQRGGEKRLNVIFSRAKHHMALVSSIRHPDITNDYNDGANSLKNFLQYAEAVSKGDESSARRVLENLNPLSRKSLAPASQDDAVVTSLAAALRSRGHEVDLNVGQSRFRCDLAVRAKGDTLYQLGILVDTAAHYAKENLLDRYLMQPSILRAFGWRFALVLTKDWYHNPDDVLNRLEKALRGETEVWVDENDGQKGVATLPTGSDESQSAVVEPPIAVPPTQPLSTTEEPPVPAPSQPSAPAAPAKEIVRYFEFIGGGSRKFWEITLSNNAFTVRFGRIGTAGQNQTKAFGDETSVRREAERLIAEKLAKGYEEKSE